MFIHFENILAGILDQTAEYIVGAMLVDVTFSPKPLGSEGKISFAKTSWILGMANGNFMEKSLRGDYQQIILVGPNENGHNHGNVSCRYRNNFKSATMD